MGQTVIVTLPLAIQGPDGIWTKEVELEETTGFEEDILADTRRVKQNAKGKKKGDPIVHPSARITEVLSRCTKRIGNCSRPDGKTRRELPEYFKETWAQAFTNDRAFALIRLRQLGLGDEYKFRTECPECGKELKPVARLDELTVNQSPLELLSAGGGVFKGVLKSGKQISWKIPRGVDEAVIADVVEERGAELMTALLAMCVVSLGGSVPTTYQLQELTSRERSEIRNRLNDDIGGIETELDIECDGCGHAWKDHIQPTSPDFFFPSETR
jgi:hypothetical protein